MQHVLHRLLTGVALVLWLAGPAPAQAPAGSGPDGRRVEGWLGAAIEREAARMAASHSNWEAARPFSPPPRFCSAPREAGDRQHVASERDKAAAAVSGVVLSALAGWPRAGIEPRDRARVALQRGTIDGYFTERILRLFGR